MKPKMICGLLLTLIGLVFSAFCLIYAVMNPVVYNGMEGLLWNFIGTDTLIPFIIAMVVMCAGLSICFWEAYRKDK